MKILVATKDTQGEKLRDFSWANEGEPVIFGFECTGKDHADKCGCGRALEGLESLKSTTTFKVIERPDITKPRLKELIITSLKKGGWISDKLFSGKEAEKLIDLKFESALKLYKFVKDFPEGTVLTKEGDNFVVR